MSTMARQHLGPERTFADHGNILSWRKGRMSQTRSHGRQTNKFDKISYSIITLEHRYVLNKLLG